MTHYITPLYAQLCCPIGNVNLLPLELKGNLGENADLALKFINSHTREQNGFSVSYNNDHTNITIDASKKLLLHV